MVKAKESFFSLSNNRFLVVLLGVVSFLVYSNTIPNYYNLDDELITENHILTDNSFSTFQKIFTEPYYKDRAGNKYEYRPVVLVVYFLEFLLFGRNPHVSHFFNVLLFSATCMMLLHMLLVLFRGFNPVALPENSSSKKHQDEGTGWLKGMPPYVVVSLSIALLFAVHPLHTEVVASIKNRDEILSLLFGLLSWFFAIRFVDSRKLPFYFLYLLFFIAGLFSKQTSITFSILIPVSILMFRQVSFKTFLTLILPIILISIVFSPIYLIYKKIALLAAQLLFLIFFYYFLFKRDVLVKILLKPFELLIATFVIFWKAIKKYVRSFSINISNGFVHFKANYKVLIGTVLTAFILSGGISAIKYLLTEKTEEIAKVKWNVQDTFHDFNELQVVPATQTPAPAVVPIAGRKLNFVEIPLLYEESSFVKFCTSFTVLGKYFQLMIVPYPLRYYYGYGQVPITGMRRNVLFSMFLHLVMFLIMGYLLVKRKHFIIAFGLLFYLVSIVPLSNLLTPIAGLMAERLAYASSLGFCIAFSYSIIYPFIYSSKRIFGIESTGWPRFSMIFFGLLLIIYTAMTVSRNFLWKDHVKLMGHDIAYMEGSARGHHLYASHLAVKASAKKQYQQPENTKRLNQAVFHFKKTLEIYPEFPNVWYDLAKVYMLLGDNKNAIDAYTMSTKKDTLNASPCFELGIVMEKAGRFKEAENAYKLAIERDPRFKEAYINLSYLYYKQERYRESIAVNEAGVKQLPGAYELYVNLGRTYLAIKDVPTALTYLERAVAINRTDKSILNMMAELYTQMGNMEKANYYRSLR